MKKSLLILLLLAISFYSCQNEELTTPIENQIDEVTPEDEAKFSGYIGGRKHFLVANRGSGTVSIFDARTTDSIATINLPDGDAAQPTYLAHSRRNRTFYVGDFANKKVVYYDDKTFEQKGEIAIEEGAFHMWANDFVGQLWVNNIVSKTTSVINLRTNTVINTLPLPTNEIPELTENAEQHDVTISLNGRFAYVTVLDGDVSYVVQYNTRTQEYIKHETVGGDAHLLTVFNKLYVPAQLANEITVFDSNRLTEQDSISFGAAHGVTTSFRHVFTTGISEGKVGVIDRFTNEIVDTVDSPFPVPHNVAVNLRGNILFLAHSGGTQTMVSFFSVDRKGKLELLSNKVSGTNPFGVLSY